MIPLPPALPPALAALGRRRQWMCWRIDAVGDKLIKKPVDPSTGRVHDAHDRSCWVGFDEAREVAAALGDHGVAFVLAADDPFWFVDVDDCLVDGAWSPLAVEVCRRLAGAAVEVSSSGQGLHLIGAGACPPHGCKNSALGLELYTEARFIAVTGTGAVGDAGADLSAALPALVADYFGPGSDVGPTGERDDWQDRPCPEWSGPTDDEELVREILASRPGMGAILRGRATLRQLWEGDVEALTLAYPSASPDQPYGQSEADAALAQHLAFWTGRNTERIRRLMLRSGLVRDKWTARGHRNYLWTTISRACGRQREVLQRRPVAPAAATQPQRQAAPVSQPPPGGGSSGDVEVGPRIVGPDQLAQVFAGCVYVRDLHRMWVPDGGLLKPDQTRAWFGGRSFAMDWMMEKTTKNAWEAITENQCYRFPRAESSCFRPELPSGAVVHEEDRDLLNTWVPINTRAVAGDPSPFLTHMGKLFPDERDRAIILAYMASLVQKPGAKFQWAPVVQGCEGNGKTVLATILTHCVGERYSHTPNPEDMKATGGKFNSWVSRRLLIVVEEVSAADREDFLDVLKPLITNRRIEIQGKGVDQVTGDNRANWILFCNKKQAMAVGKGKRRYALFFTPQQDDEGRDLARDGMDGDYFPRLYRWLREDDGLAICNHYLRSYAVPAELDPARDMHRCPTTSSTAEMLNISTGSIEQEIAEAVEEGRVGFGSPWVSSIALDRLLEDLRVGRKVPPGRRAEMMRGMGYEPHPALPKGRTPAPLPGENGRPVLYCRRDSIALQLTDVQAVVQRYVRDQGLGGPAAASASR